MRSPGPAFDLRAALSEEIRAAIDELDQSAGKAKALHRAHVRLKRARALARVGHACAPGLSSVFNDSARAVSHQLGRWRELTVLAEAARAAAKNADKKAAKALDLVASAFVAATESAPDIDTARTGLKDLLALAQVWPNASPRQIYKGAQRIARRARFARRKSGKSAAHRHEWRKREKDRLYAALLLGKAWPDSRRRKTSEKLGDTLGEERDAELLLERLSTAPIAAPQRALRALRRRREKLARRANTLGRRLHAGGV
jgi:CHAD domain-containing protein